MVSNIHSPDGVHLVLTMDNSLNDNAISEHIYVHQCFMLYQHIDHGSLKMCCSCLTVVQIWVPPTPKTGLFLDSPFNIVKDWVG